MEGEVRFRSGSDEEGRSKSIGRMGTTRDRESRKAWAQCNESRGSSEKVFFRDGEE